MAEENRPAESRRIELGRTSAKPMNAFQTATQPVGEQKGLTSTTPPGQGCNPGGTPPSTGRVGSSPPEPTSKPVPTPAPPPDK